MISEQSKRVSERAKEIYADRLQAELESQHSGKYVAIEPESGDFFIGDSFGECVAKARSAHPNRLSFVIHIGHTAAIHLAGMSMAR